jgi:hypothetical protein
MGGLFIRAYFLDSGVLEADRQAHARLAGSHSAAEDFHRGRLRLLELDAHAGAKTRPTGKRDGPFEIWTWSHAELSSFGGKAAETFVCCYNERMRELVAGPA